jgi:hypothetical protein
VATYANTFYTLILYLLDIIDANTFFISLIKIN